MQPRFNGTPPLFEALFLRRRAKKQRSILQSLARLEEMGGVQSDSALVRSLHFSDQAEAMRTTLTCILVSMQLFEGERC